MLETDRKRNRDHHSLSLILPLILAAVTVIVCTLLFIYHYKAAYNEDAGAGYFSPHDGVIILHIRVALVALLASVIMKLIWKRRLSMGVLAAISLVLPFLCYQINYRGFQKDAVFYPLVEEGGLLHFVTIHDFDGDGVNDEYDYTGDDVRVLLSTQNADDPYGVLSTVQYTIVGKGGKLNNSWVASGNGGISVYLHKSRVTYDHINITVTLAEGVDAEKISFYAFDKRLNITIESEHTVSFRFDADTCAQWQNNSLDEAFRVPIRYVAEE